MLVGSVRKAGERVRITAQLVNAANDAQVWGDRYDRDLKDIFALQDEISKAIVAALKLTLLPEEKLALEQRATTNVKAYKFYLMARQFSVMGNERHQEIIVRLCKRAVELDPSYAAPWATMAIAQWDMHRRSACAEDGQEAASRAIALDPKLADAHAALGAAHQGQGRYEVGLEACEAALRLDPDSYEGNRVAGMCSMALRRYDDAVRYFEKAAAVVETEFVAASFAPQCYIAKGDVAGSHEASRRALARVEKVIAVEPDHGRALGYGATLLAELGEAERAKEWIERGMLLDPDNTILHFNFVCALARLRRDRRCARPAGERDRQGLAGLAGVARQRHGSRSAARPPALRRAGAQGQGAVQRELARIAPDGRVHCAAASRRLRIAANFCSISWRIARRASASECRR